MGKVTAIRSKSPRTQAHPRQALQLLVVLLQTTPLVWRRILVPDDYSFWDLHVAIQDAMGWKDCHLHEFRLVDPQQGKGERLGIPDRDFLEERPCTADWEAPLSKYFSWESVGEAPAASYVYDFGDDWHHLVTLEEVLPRGSRRLPRCVAGSCACPPEDCGGVHGFEMFLEAIANPTHPEHARLLEWSGGAYHPEAFDPASVRFDDPRKRWKGAFRE